MAYHLADEERRVRLVEVFRSIGESIAANTDGDQRALIRRSALPPAAVAELKNWLTENLEYLKAAVQENRPLAEISPLAFRFATSRAIQAISVQDIPSRRRIMPHSANENFAVRSPPPSDEPDAHGQAALILAECILHALVDIKALTARQALDVVHSAEEIKTEVAALSGESATRMHQSLELLKRIGLSFEVDAD